MSYSQYGIISASDFNSFVGTTTSTEKGYLNTLWGTGYRNNGLGQTPIANISANNTVSHTEWDNFLTAFNTIAKHVGLSVTDLFTLPVAENAAPFSPNDLTPEHIITYNSLVPSKLTALFTRIGHASAQGSTSTVTTLRTAPWSDALTFTNIKIGRAHV